MITFSVNANIVSVNSIYLSWDITADDGYVVSDFSYELLRMESENGDRDTVISFNSSVSSFTDMSVNTMSNSRKYFYVIVATNNSDPSVKFESDIFSVESYPSHIGLEVIRKEKLYLKHYVKVKAYVLTAKTSGSKCSNCWNEITNERIRRNCKTCYDTGYEGGFYPPREIYIDINPDTLSVRPTPVGPSDASMITAWTSNTPYIKSNDFIKEVEDGTIWRVSDISYIKESRFVIKQMVKLTKVDNGSILHNLTIPSEWNDPWPDESLTGVPHVE